MKAMILAAGRGQRMGDLTQTIPKPLLKVGAYCLIEHLLFQLARARFHNIVINLHYLGHLIQQQLGDGQRYGVSIAYTVEPPDLETGGGIKNALPLLGADPFLVVNADVWTDFPFAELKNQVLQGLAHLILVDNPPHNTLGDFSLSASSHRVTQRGQNTLTFSGIGLYHPTLFENYPADRFRLGDALNQALQHDKIIEGTYYQGTWIDIGTPERLQALRDDY